MAITALPTPPTRDDPQNFATRADTFVAALPAFVTEANALAVEVNTNASNAATSATNAATSAGIASSAASAAQGAANYVGEWSTLTGSLTVPVSVSYQNNMYVLTSDIADVTAHTPGVSSVWLQQGVYEKPITLSANANVAPFTTYKVTATLVATLPTNPVDGMWFRFIHKSGASSWTVDRNGKNIADLAENLISNVNHKTFRLIYQASTNNYILEI